MREDHFIRDLLPRIKDGPRVPYVILNDFLNAAIDILTLKGLGAFGNGIEDPLFLQVKEAVASCYEPYLDYLQASDNHGKRVAQGQKRMQMVTDPFLGWTIEGRHFFSPAACRAKIEY